MKLFVYKNNHWAIEKQVELADCDWKLCSDDSIGFSLRMKSCVNYVSRRFSEIFYIHTPMHHHHNLLHAFSQSHFM